MLRKSVIALLLVGAIAGAAVVGLKGRDQISETEPFAVAGLEPMSIRDAEAEFWRLTPALLLVVYEAFEAFREDTIYDTLASVTHGAALEALYLERMGAMAGGGLDALDQTIHEITLLTSEATRDGSTLRIDASWQVIGTVGHAEHLHVRGNTYSAALTIAPIEGAWRITEFALLDVNRDTAGEMFEAPKPAN